MWIADHCKPLVPQENRGAETMVLSTTTLTVPPHPGRNPPPDRERDARRHQWQFLPDPPLTALCMASFTALVCKWTSPTRCCAIANCFHLTKLTYIFHHCFKIPESRLESPFPSHILEIQIHLLHSWSSSSTVANSSKLLYWRLKDVD